MKKTKQWTVRETKPHRLTLKKNRTELKSIILICLCVSCLMITHADVGEHYSESFRKHGAPVGKMIKGDHTVYLFLQNGATMREVYNTDGICIESDFISTEPKKRTLFPSRPAPQADAEATPGIAAATGSPETGRPLAWIIIAASLSGVALAGGLLVILKKKSAPAPGPITLTPVENQQSKAEQEKESKPALPKPCHKEAAFKLSRNEMHLFQALHEALDEHFIVMYHIAFERIIDILAPRFSLYLETYRDLKPLFLDFVIHNPNTDSIAAVIMLTDSHMGQGYQRKRQEFIAEIMIKNRIPILEIPLKHRYDPHKLYKMILESDRLNEGLTSESHPFSRPIDSLSPDTDPIIESL